MYACKMHQLEVANVANEEELKTAQNKFKRLFCCHSCLNAVSFRNIAVLCAVSIKSLVGGAQHQNYIISMHRFFSSPFARVSSFTLIMRN